MKVIIAGLDSLRSKAGVSVKLRRVVQSIFSVASGCVRLRNPDGSTTLSDQFDISRGVLQGDIFSPVAFIAGLMHIFKTHDDPEAGVTVGKAPHDVRIRSLEYADDAGLLDVDVKSASKRLSAIAEGSRNDAAMVISIPKTKAMHIHKKVRVSETKEDEIAAMNFHHVCPDCARPFPTKRGLAIHQGRWCDGGKTIRSRKGSLADKAVQHEKRKAKESELEHVTLEDNQLENVYSFEYLGSRLQCDGDDEADVKYRMNIAQTVFRTLSHIWNDHRLSMNMKIRLYRTAVCSTFTHACEAWDLNENVKKMINGFNSRCLHVITKKDYRDTATNPDHDLVLSIRQRRMRFLGHILRMDTSRLLRRTLVAYVEGGDSLPTGSLLQDCGGRTVKQLSKLARDRRQWNRLVNNLQA